SPEAAHSAPTLLPPPRRTGRARPRARPHRLGQTTRRRVPPRPRAARPRAARPARTARLLPARTARLLPGRTARLPPGRTARLPPGRTARLPPARPRRAPRRASRARAVPPRSRPSSPETPAMLATIGGGHLLWITSRAAGTAALLTSSVSVGVGLLMGRNLLKGRKLDLRITHEALSLATIIAIVIHAVALLGDSFFRPSIADITVPFA